MLARQRRYREGGACSAGQWACSRGKDLRNQPEPRSWLVNRAPASTPAAVNNPACSHSAGQDTSGHRAQDWHPRPGQPPAGRLEGAAAFRAFMEPFTQIVTRSALIAAVGDDEKAAVMYDTDTVPVPDAPGAECVIEGRQDHPHADYLRPAAVRGGPPPRRQRRLTRRYSHQQRPRRPVPALAGDG